MASVDRRSQTPMTVSIYAAQLASLCAGFRSAAFLRRAGGLDGSDKAIMMLGRAFAGPAAWVGSISSWAAKRDSNAKRKRRILAPTFSLLSRNGLARALRLHVLYP
ncbi:sterol carrier protein domain-containing protein [Rhizobium sp. 1399]|uniref:sterol carrier protein domain-containing protein n=1 Tax=Rhizobium sp. 1399 TaxID=2817758 RepID=UPI00286A4887|nr:sterol carrier protein domain-containing protein [Rhizobium sp. 1399]